ncbi:uncharacterized protein LOC124921387 isoform X2 [Impatiens glandulifera]|uniref:uncharacterized protein LOC124921387 isoform X2 n=1 Tax=Impatiens glandulifera TaxID=253017 RepID=UPI001FB0E917|nr:uncharacterized protein LOC124921387 isoform X2 [Impatiens glandulifera]
MKRSRLRLHPAARAGSIVSLNLFCGCSSELRNYPMGYVMGESDSIESLAIRFGSGKLIIEDDDDKDDDDEDDDDKDEDDVEDKLYRLIQIPVSIVQIHICLRLSSLGFYMKSILMLISFHAIIFCELCLRDVRHSKEMISSQNLKNTQLTNLFFKYM